MRLRLLLPALAVAVAAFAPLARAADKYPSKAVRIVVPGPPGGSNDAMARIISARLQERWGQSVIVEYKPGAGNTIGTDYVAKSPADGYTIGLVVTSHVINPSLRQKMPYDVLADFSGVMLVGFTPIYLTAPASSPFNNIADVLAYAKRHPGEVSYATPGVGTSPHFVGDYLAKLAGVELLHVPYRGGGQQNQETIAGRVMLNIGLLVSSYPFVKSGQLKSIAIADPKRSAAAPEVPTIAETIPGFNVQSFLGFVVPRGTPREVVNTIRNDMAAALRLPDVVATLAAGGVDIVASTPEEFDRFVAEQVPRWGQIVKKTGITAE